MSASTFTVPTRDGLCRWCVEHGPSACRACAQRRRRAVRLLEAGRSVGEIAELMSISRERVDRLLEQHADRIGVERHRLDRVPNAPIRELFERRRRQDPSLSATGLARRAGLSGASHLLRELGLAPTSATVKNGVRYPPRVKSTIGVDSAARILRALDCTPRDFDGL
jgi:DNA-binding CsgD family transcriptional regulator